MKVEEILKQHGQEQLLRFAGELSEEERTALIEQIKKLDWSVFEAPVVERVEGKISPIGGLTIAQIKERKGEFEAAGIAALQKNQVAAVLLAGGQGTRLGSNAPKGTFDLGLTHPVYIFERLVENLKEICAACGAFVPLLIMTSEKNDAETRTFFKKHNYFGYPAAYVRFFVQDMAASCDFNNKILLEEKGRLALSPNGNGGWYSSLVRAGLLEDELLKNIEWFNVFAVDNVLQRIADPAFVGAAILNGKACAAKVVRKSCPEERVGVLCLKDGLPDVIEYYEMPAELASLRDESGDLLYSFGVILNYLFRADKLKEIASKKIPVHRVKKKIPYLTETGEKVLPEAENGYKFETLILDMVRLMGTCLPFEVVREHEFAPVKNKTGVDSVETARALLQKNGVTL